METVQTAVKVRRAMRAFVGARNRRFELYLVLAVMTDHGSPSIIGDRTKIFHQMLSNSLLRPALRLSVSAVRGTKGLNSREIL